MLADSFKGVTGRHYNSSNCEGAIMPRQEQCSERLEQREENRPPNPALRDPHDHAVTAHPHPPRRRHTLSESSQKVLVQSHGFRTALPPGERLLDKAPPLLPRIGQFGIGHSDLDAAD